MSDSARRYQTHVTGREGEAWVQTGVRFDGMRDGVLLEAKDYDSQFIDVNTGEFYDWFGGQSSFLDEASRQIAASEDALIEWHFSEESTLHAFEQWITPVCKEKHYRMETVGKKLLDYSKERKQGILSLNASMLLKTIHGNDEVR